MELLKHVAQQHENIVDKKATTSEITAVKELDEVMEMVEDGKFKCARCIKIVPCEDTFNVHEGIQKRMYQFCTMVSQYE